MRLSAVLSILWLGVGGLLSPALAAEDEPAYGPQLEGFEYPWPVAHFSFTSQGQALDMAYMDVKPTAASNGETVVLLHGKNFCAATWQETIAALTAHGYRVIAPDQIGFCKSTKPAHYQYTFQQLAGNTHALLGSLGIDRITLIGHSIGGMLSMRYALTFPADVKLLVLVDPIGLEDWKAKGVPWQKRRRLVSARAKDNGRNDSRVPAHDLLRRNVGGEIRSLGADACRSLSRARA